LADFGFTSEGNSTSICSSNDGRGTACYRAPELVKFEGYTNKTDVWSIGCILFELATDAKAFRSDSATTDYTNGDLKVQLDNYFGDRCKEIITETIGVILRVEPVLRPSAANLFEEFSQNFQSLYTAGVEKQFSTLNIAANSEGLISLLVY
jgi:serine/threonine protein kinase